MNRANAGPKKGNPRLIAELRLRPVTSTAEAFGVARSINGRRAA
jgi:hypothetical protein